MTVRGRKISTATQTYNMSSSILCARRSAFKVFQALSSQQSTRLLSTIDASASTAEIPPTVSAPAHGPNTHYKITHRRSAISLGDRKKGTLKALGLHRRMQTVYHKHSQDIAGKILSLGNQRTSIESQRIRAYDKTHVNTIENREHYA